jgi:hypothetical protein
MEILFFSINLIGCLVYFLFAMKSHNQKNNQNNMNKFSEDETSMSIKKIDERLSKIENSIVK